MLDIISREDAKLLGLNKFYTGPCKQGHLSERYVSSSECIACRKLYKKQHYINNKEAYEQNSKRYRSNNAAELKAKSRIYYSENSDYIKSKSSERYNLQKADILESDKRKRNIARYGTETPTPEQVRSLTLATNRAKYSRDWALQKDWLEKSFILINCPLWLTYHHKILKESCGEISDKYISDIHPSTIGLRLRNFGIGVDRFVTSKAEKQIVTFIDSLGIFSNRGCRKIIEPYELDIYIPSHSLAIEYCGLYWHSEVYKNSNYHKEKYELCKLQGIRLLTIFEDEWAHNQHMVEDKIKHVLKLSDANKIFARKCRVGNVSTVEKTIFFNKNHIQGNGPSSINIGLYYDNVLVACIGIISERHNTYNISRYATTENVAGGFSKLLSFFEKTYSPSRLYTFADLRWSNGELYKKTGFDLDKILEPDYSYIDNQKLLRLHKFNFRHRRLQKMLEAYDPALTEHENCLNHNIYRIYDCGKLKYVKNYERA